MRNASLLFSGEWRPVEDAVAQQINKHVGDSDVPQQFTFWRYVLHESAAINASTAFRCSRPDSRFILFDRRQTAELRRIAHHCESEQRAQSRQRLAYIERRFQSLNRHPQQEQQWRGSAADVMRAVPDRHNAAAFFLRPPVNHQASARQPPHPLEPAKEQQYKHHAAMLDHAPTVQSRHKQHDCCGRINLPAGKRARIRAIGHRTL